MGNLDGKKHGGVVDKIAISMALLCAVHCLIVPILIVSLPLINTTFFVHEDFHLWMLIAVFPTTLASILLGCRKHKDKYVLFACAVGLGLLIVSFIMEQQGIAHCSSCAQVEAGGLPSNIAWLNSLGGLFLILAHSRNFYLCRKLSCCEKDGGNGCCQ